ncbi:MAG TPA: fumarate hydratase [Thermoplasmatales archaeon]|nr:fumarate hydratase [Thermoplasmatales archaeon]
MEDGIVELIRRAETILPQDVVEALEKAVEKEEGVAKTQLETILKNIDVARETNRPICQDTGVQTFFIEAGVKFPYLLEVKDWIHKAVKRATSEIPIRPNAVDSITGENLGFNIPVINWELIKGDNLLVTVLPKGAGSENMSTLRMLQPNDGLEGVKKVVVETVVKAGGNPCPPTIIGVGIGGTADLAMHLGKKALLRRVGSRHLDPKISSMEKELINIINESGVGPMGLGGKTTVLDVHIEVAPRHPASLPVGIVIQCWAHRRATMRIYPDLRWEFL